MTNADRPSPAEYSAFIAQLELVSIWLRSFSFQNHIGASGPESAEVQIKEHSAWQPWDEGFDAFTNFSLDVRTTTQTVASGEVSFSLRFKSAEAMSEPLFTIFSRMNLPVNSWPYLREIVGSTFARMGWSPITLPLLKRGVKAKRDEGDPKTQN